MLPAPGSCTGFTSPPTRLVSPYISTAATATETSPYAGMGFVDDAEIEAHVREMLARRAAG